MLWLLLLSRSILVHMYEFQEYLFVSIETFSGTRKDTKFYYGDMKALIPLFLSFGHFGKHLFFDLPFQIWAQFLIERSLC